MKEKSLGSIASLSPPERTVVVSEGLRMLAEHVEVLTDDAKSLWEGKRYRSAKVIEHLAAEQAGAFLILFDLMRAGASLTTMRRKELITRFYNHRARAMYVEAYGSELSGIDEAQKFIDLYRDDLSLDGPNDIDWILRNELDHNRESAMYVDLVNYEGSLRWESPKMYEYEPISRKYSPPRAVSVVLALHAAGLADCSGVQATVDVWASIDVERKRQMSWAEAAAANHEVLARLVSDKSSGLFSSIEDSWVFPLTTVDMSRRKVAPDHLRKLQQDTIAAEFGY